MSSNKTVFKGSDGDGVKIETRDCQGTNHSDSGIWGMLDECKKIVLAEDVS